ncbi:MAG: alpha/beta fold hydrolase [Gemmatimonadales bacterium]
MTAALILTGVVVALVVTSYIVEALRPSPARPERLAWAPDIPIRYLALDDEVRLRYIVAGDGPPLVLLHTLRTQLDMFQKVIPQLARRYRVYALDYPGHGWSDIPPAEYSPELFVSTVARFLDRLDIKDATLVGESIGGSIVLLLAARRHPAVQRVVAINPYDYDRGRGLRRSSPLANLIFGLSRVPVLGSTVMRLRNPIVETIILHGGVRRAGAFPAGLAREVYAVGNRPGHFRAFSSLVRHWPSWEALRTEYRSIALPVLLLYGDHDWSHPGEREANLRDIPGAQLTVVSNAGHFLALDAPDDLVRSVAEFVPDHGAANSMRFPTAPHTSKESSS